MMYDGDRVFPVPFVRKELPDAVEGIGELLKGYLI
jgi:hypothetical protein